MSLFSAKSGNILIVNLSSEIAKQVSSDGGSFTCIVLRNFLIESIPSFTLDDFKFFMMASMTQSLRYLVHQCLTLMDIELLETWRTPSTMLYLPRLSNIAYLVICFDKIPRDLRVF